MGTRCDLCGYATAPPTPRCPACGGITSGESFEPQGIVWASTVVHIPVGRREPPFGLAYVDVNEGPRILAHLADAALLPVGTSVTLVKVDGEVVARTAE